MPIISETMRPVSDAMETKLDLDEITPLHDSSRGNLYTAVSGGKRYCIKAAVSDSGKDVAMLQREYELMSGLSHPFIPHLHSYLAESPVGPCIVMDYVEGRTLEKYLMENPSRKDKRQVFAEILDAVEYLHKSGVVHNDLTPANILVSEPDNYVKIIDFGFSDDNVHFVDHSLGGTRHYASPELIAGEKVDARSDIYSLGIILGEMFPGRNRLTVRRCTAAAPADRFASVAALRKALFPKRAAFIAAATAAAAAVLLTLLLSTNGNGPRHCTDPDFNDAAYGAAVDLGLSVLWRDCNLGARKPQDLGMYLAWGESDPKEIYDWPYYKYCDGTNSVMTKYSEEYDGLTRLEPCDDAAAVRLGDGWRMPTEAEFKELADNCTWQRDTVKGTVGMRATGPSGASIFLPATGVLTNEAQGPYDVGKRCIYRSSDLRVTAPHLAIRLIISLGTDSTHFELKASTRQCGHTVRPVKER